MKSILNKKISFLYLGIFLYQFIILPIKSLAVATPASYIPLENGVFDNFSAGNAGAADQLGTFLAKSFQFGLALAAALAVIMIVWGGTEIMLSESVFKQGEGRKRINEALFGLLLAFAAWIILYTINPDILNFKL